MVSSPVISDACSEITISRIPTRPSAPRGAPEDGLDTDPTIMKRKNLVPILSLVLLLSAPAMVVAEAAAPPVSTAVDDTGPTTGQDPLWLTDLETAVAEAKARDRYLLVDLFAEWCGWCHRLEDEVFTHPDFVAYAEDFVLLRVDTEDGAVGSWLQLRYGAESLPATLVLDSDMVRVGKVQGFAPMPTFVRYVEEQVNGYLAILSFYDQLLASDDAELQRQVAQDLLERGAGRRAAGLYQRVLEQIRRGTEAEAWLTYQLADALRIGRDWDAARRHLAVAHELATALGAKSGAKSAELEERVDLLSVHLAQESGDCDGALTSLQRFLDVHPKSAHASYAAQTLDAIKKGEVMQQCT